MPGVEVDFAVPGVELDLELALEVPGVFIDFTVAGVDLTVAGVDEAETLEPDAPLAEGFAELGVDAVFPTPGVTLALDVPCSGGKIQPACIIGLSEPVAVVAFAVPGVVVDDPAPPVPDPDPAAPVAADPVPIRPKPKPSTFFSRISDLNIFPNPPIELVFTLPLDGPVVVGVVVGLPPPLAAAAADVGPLIPAAEVPGTGIAVAPLLVPLVDELIKKA